MNSKFLVWTSLLIALLFHLAFFNLTTIVFPIDSTAFKPKFFFLGPILRKSDVKSTLPRYNTPDPNSVFKNTRFADNTLKSFDFKIIDRTENPFAIRTIKKPLTQHSDLLQNKTTIKSTFEILLEEETVDEPNKELRLNSEITIRPYKPLRFRPH